MDNNTYSLDNIIEAYKSLAEEKKWVEKLKDKIINKILSNDLELEYSKEYIISFIRKFEYSYTFNKELFSNIYRTSWERYFEHLRGVVEILLEIPNPTPDKILIALFHDTKEDIEEANFENIAFVSRDYKIAIAVEAISKKNWSEYSENKSEWKGLRDIEYFSHLESFEKMANYVIYIAKDKWYELTIEEVQEITQNIFDVKYADRIHNLSTQWDLDNIEKVKEKIAQTEKYFLEWAKIINPIAYSKLKSEILKLKLQIEQYDKKISDIIN